MCTYLKWTKRVLFSRIVIYLPSDTPYCAVTEITKYAVKRGQSISLPCHVMASPSNVTLTWTYQLSNEFIKTMTPTSGQQRDESVEVNMNLLIRQVVFVLMFTVQRMQQIVALLPETCTVCFLSLKKHGFEHLPIYPLYF